MPEKLKYHERVRELKATIDQVADSLDVAIKAFANLRPDGVKSLMMEQRDFMRNRVALIVPGRRSTMTPEERQRKDAVKRNEKRLDKMVSWLKLDGMEPGCLGLRSSDQAQVRFLSIPTRTLEGIKVRVEFIDVNGVAIRQQDVDAMAFRPDFSAPPKATPAPRTRSASKSTHVPKRARKGSAPRSATA